MRADTTWAGFVLLGLAILLVPKATAQKQSAADPALIARLHQAANESLLEDAQLKPWHLKLSFQLFNDAGTQNDEGTIEEWWSNPALYKIVYASHGYAATEIRNKDGFYRTQGTEAPPQTIEALRLQIVQPMPVAHVLDISVPVLRKEKFGSTPFDCIFLYGATMDRTTTSLLMTHGACMSAGTTSLRVTNYLDNMMVRNRLGRFQGKEVAIDELINAGKAKIATAHVETLQTIEEPNELFVPSAETEKVSEPSLSVPASIIEGTILSQVRPVFPMAAKMAQKSGTVILRATIGKSGYILSAKPILNPDPAFATSAVEAVKQWRYKPWLLNGEPVEVDTAIQINFNFGR